MQKTLWTGDDANDETHLKQMVLRPILGTGFLPSQTRWVLLVIIVVVIISVCYLTTWLGDKDYPSSFDYVYRQLALFNEKKRVLLPIGLCVSASSLWCGGGFSQSVIKNWDIRFCIWMLGVGWGGDILQLWHLHHDCDYGNDKCKSFFFK